VFGLDAFMHLHIVNPEFRHKGLGADFVRESARHYFRVLELERLYSEPNAFNTAPNRTLQRAGFHYLFTHEAQPSPMNYRQVTNRWMMERHESV
jgi:RimJ/RimL family protein N-acetyltransferase